MGVCLNNKKLKSHVAAQPFNMVHCLVQDMAEWLLQYLY